MLSSTAEYALRAMVFLARSGSDTALLGRDLSAVSGVPANYLSKILLTLKRAGMVTAVRGQGGGYRLSRDPKEIKLIEVVEVFDRPRAHPRCLLSFEEECSEHDACSAHDRWKLVREVYLNFLESTALSDISEAVPEHAISGKLNGSNVVKGAGRDEKKAK
jgi:Rrf2 family transcriptional regulator, iron-sulfur cluster assembly transcription factor